MCFLTGTYHKSNCSYNHSGIDTCRCPTSHHLCQRKKFLWCLLLHCFDQIPSFHQGWQSYLYHLAISYSHCLQTNHLLHLVQLPCTPYHDEMLQHIIFPNEICNRKYMMMCTLTVHWISESEYSHDLPDLPVPM